MVLTEQQRQIGKDNFRDALEYSRRKFLAGAAVGLPSVTAFYWGYSRITGGPVRVGLIGTGDQGNAHIRSANPEFIKIVAFSDIRPKSQKTARVSLESKYGADARNVELYEDYHKLLDRGDIEMVIISLPLHLHAPCAIEAMQKGKHVLCEKLMAKTVLDCKQMVRAVRKTGKYLAVGHQRHYSYLYANALEIVRQKDVIGDIKHIRAFWHRNQTGGGKPGAETGEFDGWHRSIAEEDKKVDFAKYGYKSLEELVRWRLYARTGGGLMVELGSHQLDAVGIFLSEVLGHKDPKAPREPVHPLAVSGVGSTAYFTDGREVEDHIFLTYEFPQNTVVTYSSICTNEFDQYGELVLGTKGTLAVLSEKDVYVFKEKAPKDTRITWAERRIGEAVTTSTSTAQWVVDVGIPDTLGSRGYREEQEHLAWLIRNPGQGQPRCSGEVALGDAVVTLASNVAMREKRRIQFKKEWFDVGSDAGPENG